MTEKTEVRDMTSYEDAHWNSLDKISKIFAATSIAQAMGRKSFDLMVILQAGYEMGLQPMQAMHDLYTVPKSGKVATYAEGTIMRLRMHGWKIAYKDETQSSCTAVVSRKNTDEEYTETFTFQEAVDSGYTQSYNLATKKWIEKPGWRAGANRKLKLRYQAIARIIKTYIPEVLQGVSMGDVLEDGMDSLTFESADKPPVELKTSKFQTTEVITEVKKDVKPEDIKPITPMVVDDEFNSILKSKSSEIEKAHECQLTDGGDSDSVLENPKLVRERRFNEFLKTHKLPAVEKAEAVTTPVTGVVVAPVVPVAQKVEEKGQTDIFAIVK